MNNGSVHGMRHQGGFALIAILALLAVWGLSVFVGQLSATQFQTARAQNTAAALVEAREALLGDAIARSPVSDAGYFSLPDLGAGVGGVPAEGQVSPTFAGDGKDLSVIGKFPWKTLDTTVLRDAQGECLWYIVSGRFKNELKTDALNWDTQGQIDIIDGTGNLIAKNLAAMVVAPQIALDGQSRALADPVYRECGGNYDARNYLDSIQIDNAIAGEVNYFVGSTNNRVAANASNKRFVMANSTAYNDRFLYITVEDIFDRLIRRSDFAGAIGNLLDSPVFQGHLRSIVIAGNKGTDNINCANAPDLSFCRNWKEMLFLSERSVAEPINVNGTSCSRVLIFAGRKAAGQSRSTALDKTNKNNYLEGVNASSFNVPTAASPNFSGTAVFDWRTPSTDLVRCLP